MQASLKSSMAPSSPTVLFAIPPTLLNKNRVDELFRQGEVRPVFVHSPTDLDEASSQYPGSLIFLDLLFNSDPLFLISRFRSRGHSFVVLAEELFPNEESALEKLGVQKCLLRPVHAEQLLQIARLFLDGPTGLSRSNYAKTRVDQKTSIEFPDLKSVEPWVEICAKIARKIERGVAIDTKVWPSLSSVSPSNSRGHTQLLKNTQSLVTASARVICAERCGLFSLRPLSLWSSDECSPVLRVLASSDAVVSGFDLISAALFPQLVLAVRRREALFIPHSIPSLLAGVSRPQEWMLKGQVEKVSAVLPVFEGKRIFAVVLCQFEDFDVRRWNLVEQAASFFQQASQSLAQLDFMARLYHSRG
jgi:hypothetical protein